VSKAASLVGSASHRIATYFEPLGSPRRLPCCLLRNAKKEKLMGTLTVARLGKNWFQFIGTAESIIGMIDTVDDWIADYTESVTVNELADEVLRQVVVGRLNTIEYPKEETIMLISSHILQMPTKPDGMLADYLLHQDIEADVVKVGEDGDYRIDIELSGMIGTMH
jgi:hypothetical protein